MGLGLGVEGRPLIVETHRHETRIMTGQGRLFVSFGGSNRDVKDDVNSFVSVSSRKDTLVLAALF